MFVEIAELSGLRGQKVCGRSRRARSLVLVQTAALVALILAPACKGDSTADSPAKSQEIRKPVSEAAAKQFTDELVTALQNEDTTKLSTLFDIDRFFERTSAGIEVPSGISADFKRGFSKGLSNSLFQGWLQQARASRVDGLPPRMVAGQQVATVRFILKEGGFEHFEFELAETESGAVKAVDQYSLVSGANLSTLLQPMIAATIRDLSKNAVLKLIEGNDSLLLKYQDELGKMNELKTSGDFKSWYAEYGKLPKEVRDHELMLHQALIYSGNVEDESVQRTYFDRMSQLYPDNTALAVAAIDVHTVAGRHDEALKTLDKLKARSAADPYMDFLRGSVLHLAGRNEEARKQLRDVVKNAPEIADAYWTLISVELKLKAFVEVRTRLIEVAKTHNLALEIDGVPEYATFVASKEYAQFKIDYAKLVESRNAAKAAGVGQ